MSAELEAPTEQVVETTGASAKSTTCQATGEKSPAPYPETFFLSPCQRAGVIKKASVKAAPSARRGRPYSYGKHVDGFGGRAYYRPVIERTANRSYDAAFERRYAGNTNGIRV